VRVTYLAIAATILLANTCLATPLITGEITESFGTWTRIGEHLQLPSVDLLYSSNGNHRTGSARAGYVAACLPVFWHRVPATPTWA